MRTKSNTTLEAKARRRVKRALSTDAHVTRVYFGEEPGRVEYRTKHNDPASYLHFKVRSNGAVVLLSKASKESEVQNNVKP